MCRVFPSTFVLSNYFFFNAAWIRDVDTVQLPPTTFPPIHILNGGEKSLRRVCMSLFRCDEISSIETGSQHPLFQRDEKAEIISSRWLTRDHGREGVKVCSFFLFLLLFL